ncbi:RrF2 family transcriptional regulator [Lacicoccus qingdaonensis]|uniref:Transcriptional regulator, BadM/Rrf2 family n=1 Tax=Lacicoccus qingdaonensis TaxID=576118 RepID=A0A1G9AK06_9BACL|nr:Rrf2 family transcriptional regulator [Salinicoccus qingdaonensis]SDK27608.1 transcriptional regulator, BadM/Rrf2 family [Salinicoccus qingdaonensis]
MKISTRGRYGLYFMLALARDYGEKKRSVKSVATEREISDLYLEQIVASLKKESLVKSTRGAYGGYELNHPPEDITVGQIFKTVEENIVAVESDEKDSKNERFLWGRIRDAISDVLDHTTLKDMVDYDGEGLDDYMFHI